MVEEGILEINRALEGAVNIHGPKTTLRFALRQMTALSRLQAGIHKRPDRRREKSLQAPMCIARLDHCCPSVRERTSAHWAAPFPVRSFEPASSFHFFDGTDWMHNQIIGLNNSIVYVIIHAIKLLSLDK
jgi:hypothetical protein